LARYWFLSTEPDAFARYLAAASHSDKVSTLGQLALMAAHVARLVDAAKPVWRHMPREVRDAPVFAVPRDVAGLAGAPPPRSPMTRQELARTNAQHQRYAANEPMPPPPPPPPPPSFSGAQRAVPVLSPWAPIATQRDAPVDWRAVQAALEQLAGIGRD
jgi:hypothetical protein